MKLRVLTACAAVAALSFSTTGCGQKDAAAAEGGAAAPAKVLRIGVSIPTADHGWTGGVVYWANRVKKELESENADVRVLVSAAKDSAEQVSGIENLLVQGVDALVVLPSEPAPLTPVCKDAVAQGVKLVVVDRGLTEPVMDLEVVGDNPGFGRVGAEELVKAIGGKGKIAYMEGVPCQVNSDRVNAFKAVIANYPEIEIVGSGAAEWNTEKGLRLMENFLQANPHLDAVWTGDDDVLLGALVAYRESGRSDLKTLIGGAGAKAVVKMILDGDPLVTVTVTYPPQMIAVATRRALDLLRGEVPEAKREIVPAEVINAANAKDNYFPDSAF